MHYESKYFSIDILNPKTIFVILCLHYGYCTRYEYGDENEHIFGITICNLHILFYWRCKDEEQDGNII